MPRKRKKQPLSRSDRRFRQIFWVVLSLTIICIGIGFLSCRNESAREAFNETLLTTIKMGFGAIIALLGRYAK